MKKIYKKILPIKKTVKYFMNSDLVNENDFLFTIKER